MAKKQYVVIGLGTFGRSVAETLYSMGNDVLAMDCNEELVQEMSDVVTHAVQGDAADENTLKTLGVRNFDVAIVTVGNNIQSSVMITLLVKELGVKYIIAKAKNDLHAKILYKIGADRVIFPEKDMGVRVAHNIVSSSIFEYIELSPDYSIMEFQIYNEWIGKTLVGLGLRDKYGINVIAIKRNNKVNLSPSANDVLQEKDILVAIGSGKDLGKLENLIVKKG